MRSTTSSTSSMTPSENGGHRKLTTQLAGGAESKRKGAGLQESILQAILVDPLPIVAAPVKLPIAPRPPSICINDEDDLEEGKENGGVRRGGIDGQKKSQSVSSIEDNEVFQIVHAKRDPEEVDVTMSVPLTPSTPIAVETTLLAPGVERSMSAMKNASSFLDITSASSTFNRSQRPKSVAIEELPDEWKEWLRACTDGDMEKAKEVLKKDPLLINWSPPLTARMAGLHLAVRGCHLKMATWLVTQGANVDQTTLSGYTPLHIAAQHRNRGMVNELKRLGADQMKKDLFGRRYDHYVPWKEERIGHRVEAVPSKESMRSSCASNYSDDSAPPVARSRAPSIYSRESLVSGASSFGRTSSIRDALRGLIRNPFKKSNSIEKLPL